MSNIQLTTVKVSDCLAVYNPVCSSSTNQVPFYSSRTGGVDLFIHAYRNI